MTSSLLTSPHLAPLPYRPDSLEYFHIIGTQLPMTLILQSESPPVNGQAVLARSRYDIITAAPEYWLETRSGNPILKGSPPDNLRLPQCSSLGALHWLVEQIQNRDKAVYDQLQRSNLPFYGGLIGYCSYDLAREFIPLPARDKPALAIPAMQFGFYSWACIQDHQRSECWLVFHPDCPQEKQHRITQLLSNAGPVPQPAGPESDCPAFTSNMTAEEYREAFARIQSYIQAGDCYQINFAQRFSASSHSSPANLYTSLRKTMPSPFCSFFPLLGIEGDAIICLSPERFVRMDRDGHVVTQPIKGTAPRNSNPEHDRLAAEKLQSDQKNRAENIMIVDLLRNDLGRVCQTGTIMAKQVLELQSFSNVHHLVSTIEGQLRHGLNSADLLQACFPGGSITGAPKIRAMQIIDELEPDDRSIYCGSIVVISADGSMDSNIMIRTVLCHQGMLFCWGGGGIVADSDPESEYNESLVKISPILEKLSKGPALKK